ncbi:MAG: NADH-quinone oxidoreductase subunit C [Rhodospirillaceae bacterium]|nr:NADH-quinone oxidoreductase subunit C [Rhodospirillaceae bacterium]
MELALKNIGELIVAALPQTVTATDISFGELNVSVKAGDIVRVLTYLRDDANCQFKILVDVCGVDHPERDQRFDVVYNLLSMTHNLRIRVKVRTGENEPVPTVSDIFSSAGWWEREAWDLYGIYFSGHHDLRRIMTDYGFEGHPLRKDFPLTGYVELRYDDQKKRVVYEPVKLAQDFRSFDFVSPWEGVQSRLPGDEKATQDDDDKAEGKGT